LRKSALIISAAALAAVAAPAALAVNASQGLDVAVNPSKAGTKAKPKIVKLTVTTTTTPHDNTPFATKRAIIYFDKSFHFNGKAFKSCSKATLDASGPSACPAGSKVGTGNAQGVALGQTENLTVTPFNGPGGNKIELYVQGSAPLQINSTIEGVLHKASGQFGQKLVVDIPNNLQQPLSGVYATLTRFQTAIYAFATKTTHGKKSKVGYVETVGCNKKWYFKGDFQYTDGTGQNASTTVRCS
jgi:hypothetical protein